MLVFTLADRSAELITVARHQLASVAASHPGDTLIRLTDGRRFRVREPFVDVLDSWQTERHLY